MANPMLQKALVVAYYKINGRVMDNSCRGQLEVLGGEHSRVAKTLEKKKGEMANRRYLKVRVDTGL